MKQFRTNMMLVIVLLMTSFPVTTQASTPSEDNITKGIGFTGKCDRYSRVCLQWVSICQSHH